VISSVSRRNKPSVTRSSPTDNAEQTGSQSYVPPDESEDKAIKMGLDLLRRTATNAALPNPKAAVHN
jgi:carboxyl-terminal processing protease